MNLITTAFSKIFKSGNQQELNKIKPIINQINDREPSLKSLSDHDLKEKTLSLKKRVKPPKNKIKAPVTAKSGKKSYDMFSKKRYAWVVDNKDEIKLITTMKKASRLMIIGNTDKGEQTTDHYSMMGFTKAYNTAKKNCS